MLYGRHGLHAGGLLSALTNLVRSWNGMRNGMTDRKAIQRVVSFKAIPGFISSSPNEHQQAKKRDASLRPSFFTPRTVDPEKGVSGSFRACQLALVRERERGRASREGREQGWKCVTRFP